jgi:recombinational DNA repair protein RecR
MMKERENIKEIGEIIEDFREAVKICEECERKTDETAIKSGEKKRRRILKTLKKKYKEYIK